ncbi:CMRF35-like molecule 8 isoform X1 [Silurus meridionalis]|uniref:CMRF35-like molecule 8 isoform X1 n=1 Tax=Silurus meridionalis TaxID=175797 RepID=UPI001EEA7CB4|nr:CMRF35-like molecule 8 isoform X1 [Silurus meridionalis]XP_046694037.1 CMRF35-like molecule 8 isoform X1 [Silurus meridionalis]
MLSCFLGTHCYWNWQEAAELSDHNFHFHFHLRHLADALLQSNIQKCFESLSTLHSHPGRDSERWKMTNTTLRMKIVLIFSFCLIIAGSDAVTTITGYRGRSFQIKCPYDPGYETYKKYICRGKCTAWEHVWVKSGSPAKDTRFSLYDDTTAKIFTITITDLRAQDEGTYWCGIERAWPTTDIYTKLRLLVKLDDPANSTVSQSTTYSASTNITSPSVHAETPPATDHLANSTVSQSTHTTYSASTNITSPSVHSETPPATNVPGSATYLLISTGAVVFIAGVIIAIYCKRKCQGPVTSSKETSDVYENEQHFNSLQARVNIKLPESVCKTPDPTTSQSESIYQNSVIIDDQSDSVYQNLTVTNSK